LAPLSLPFLKRKVLLLRINYSKRFPGVVSSSVNAGICGFDKIKTGAQNFAPLQNKNAVFVLFGATAARIARVDNDQIKGTNKAPRAYPEEVIEFL
jgi:hypothetical protein